MYEFLSFQFKHRRTSVFVQSPNSIHDCFLNAKTEKGAVVDYYDSPT